MPPLGDRSAVADRYEIGALLGRGGMGEVYHAHDLRLDRPVALKRLRADLVEDPAMRRRVEAEARLAARLVHPRVVTVFDSGVDERHPFIVMERLDGRTLRDELASGPLSEQEVRELGLQLLDALGAAHDIGLIHRDVKPGNVLASPGGWKIGDFGIATSVEADHTITRTGELLGSPSYLAPERLEGRPATAQSDLYSLGVLLYETLTGVRPFGDGEPFTIAMRIRDGAHTPLTDLAPGVDRGLAAAIERAMSHDPVDRFASATEMAMALRGDGPDTGDAATTAVIDRAPERTEVLAPIAAPNSTLPIPSATRGVRARGARHAPGLAPRRLLTLLIGAAVAIALVVVAMLVWSLADDTTPGRTAVSTGPPAPASGVPVPLQEALDRLQETISP